MIIEIQEDLFNKIKSLMKNRNIAIYEELENIKPLDNIPSHNTLQQAREVKTKRVKQTIKETIKSLLEANKSPTRYQIHKLTNIAYITINKYYDEILKEVG